MAQNLGDGADAAGDLAVAAGGIDFGSAVSSAAQLAATLGVALGTAVRIRAMGSGVGDPVIHDPRDPRFDAGRAFRDRVANHGFPDPVMNRGPVGGGGGGGGGGPVRDLAAEYQNLVETLDPAVRAASAFREAQELINEALAGGAIGAEQASYALGLAQERYDDATNSANDFADAARRGADEASSLFGGILLQGKDAIDMLADLFKRMAMVQMQNAFTGLSGTGAGGGIFAAIGAMLTPIGANANGTNNWRGGLTRVNERGGEIMNLPGGTQIIPHDVSMAMARGSGGTLRVIIEEAPGFASRVRTEAVGVAIEVVSRNNSAVQQQQRRA